MGNFKFLSFFMSVCWKGRHRRSHLLFTEEFWVGQKDYIHYVVFAFLINSFLKGFCILFHEMMEFYSFYTVLCGLFYAVCYKAFSYSNTVEPENKYSFKVITVVQSSRQHRARLRRNYCPLVHCPQFCRARVKTLNSEEISGDPRQVGG